MSLSATGVDYVVGDRLGPPLRTPSELDDVFVRRAKVQTKQPRSKH